MTTCTFPDCKRAPIADGNRCEAHRLRWLPREPVEQPAVSPWVRRALAHRLPPKAVA